MLSTEIKDDQTRAYIDNMNYAASRAEYDRMVEDLRSKESPDWKAVNRIGCIGWFQFSPATLKRMGYGHITPARFRKDPCIFPPESQLQALDELVSLNQRELDPLYVYIGRNIKGTRITRSGLIAGAHLGGVHGVGMYLRSGGKINNSDLFGTSIGDYIRDFGGYRIDYYRVKSLFRIRINNGYINHIITEM